MPNIRNSLLGLTPIVAIGTVGVAWASPVEIRKNDVVPVRFDSQLSTGENRSGDPFTATPENDTLFPVGTRFEGHIARIATKSNRHPASMDLVFDDVRLPDGSRHDIRGVPVPLTAKYVDRDADGHYIAKASVRKDTAVGVGAIAGLLVGALLHKPFEGTFVGTLAGILVASTAGDDRTLVISRGAEAGVMFQRDERIDLGGSASEPTQRDPGASASALSALVGGKQIQYSADMAPFRSGSTLMVPIQFTAKQLGLSYDESESSIFTENDSHSIRFEENSRSYRVDGRSDTLDSSVIQRNGVWYAPARAFDVVTGH